MKNTGRISLDKNGPLGTKKTRQIRKNNGKKNKRGDSKVGPNDSPEIPDREETSDTPSLPFGVTPQNSSM